MNDGVACSHDEANTRYLATVPTGAAELRYSMVSPTVLDFESTFVPPHLRKQGIGAILVRYALRHAHGLGYKMVATCWFVRPFLELEEFRHMKADE